MRFVAWLSEGRSFFFLLTCKVLVVDKFVFNTVHGFPVITELARFDTVLMPNLNLLRQGMT